MKGQPRSQFYGVPFDERYSPEPMSGCWLWLAATQKSGHGVTWISGRLVPAHRVAYERAIGPIPAGLQVLHRCDNPPCVNPAHLFLGTQGDNMRDMWAKGRTSEQQRVGAGQRKASKTHCPRGHAYSDANTYRSKGTGYRHCRACRTVAAKLKEVEK